MNMEGSVTMETPRSRARRPYPKLLTTASNIVRMAMVTLLILLLCLSFYYAYSGTLKLVPRRSAGPPHVRVAAIRPIPVRCTRVWTRYRLHTVAASSA